ncbi:hypothetical protein OROMI_015495 [Orobanche minor]
MIRKVHDTTRIAKYSIRGQRDRDRERAQARAGHKQKNSKDDGLTPEQRRERDAKALQEKAARKTAQGTAGGKENAGNDNIKNNKKK